MSVRSKWMHIPVWVKGPVVLAVIGTMVFLGVKNSYGGFDKTYDVTMSKWVLAATFSASGITTGFRGVAGYASAGTVTLMASTAETALNHLVVFVDTGSGAPTATTITAAASGMIYRGVAVSPHF